MYQGQNYVYVSDLPSHSQNYGGSDGYTNFGDLLRQQAVRLAPMYVDTTGGGGSADAPSDVYFRPNEDLEFVDRLPTGEFTAGAARRTDSPIPPGDGIYNSADDAFYGGLQAGNDGLYGTMDDYYGEGFTSDAQGSPISMPMLITTRNCWIPVTPWQISVSLTSSISFRPSPMFVR